MNQSIKKEVFTIPNLLSMFRLVLACIIPVIYYHSNIDKKIELLLLVIILSGITDVLDGKIARKFHMISEIGKILDPIADKLTQGVLLICLLPRTLMAIPILAMFLVKEAVVAFFGWIVIQKTKRNEGAKWYGKMNTVVFYIIVILLIVFPDMPLIAANSLMCICGTSMVMTFILYMRQYRQIVKEINYQNGN